MVFVSISVACHEGRERRDGNDAEKRTVRRASADGRLRESGDDFDDLE